MDSTYSKYHKSYYERNKLQLQTKNREYWTRYYQANRDKIREKASNRYYLNKDKNAPPSEYIHPS